MRQPKDHPWGTVLADLLRQAGGVYATATCVTPAFRLPGTPVIPPSGIDHQLRHRQAVHIVEHAA